MHYGKKKRTIVFKRLSILNFPVAVFFSLLKFRVFHLYSVGWLHNDFVYETLKAIDIRPINFEECNKLDVSIVDSDSRRISLSVFEDLFPDKECLSIFTTLFSGVSDIESKLKVVLLDLIKRNITGLPEAICWIEDFVRNDEKIYMFFPNNILIKSALKCLNRECINLYPVSFYYLLNFSQVFLRTTRSSFIRLHSHLKRLIENKNLLNPTTNLVEKKAPDVSQYEIIYFPHQSIFFGNLFLKDQFYISDKESPFHMSKILHIELNRSEISADLHIQMLDFYKKNDIPFCFLTDVQRSDSIPVFNFLQFTYENLLGILKLNIPDKIFALFAIWRIFKAFRKNIEVLDQFKMAKIGLIGYENLFPPTLSLALEACKIKTIAIQERFLGVFYYSLNFILDTYLTCSDMCGEFLQNNDAAYIHKYKSIGLTRSDLLCRYSRNKNDDSCHNQKRKKIVLALDYLSYTDKYENFRQVIINWRSNKSFLKDLIRLSFRFSDIHIIIHGKNDLWVNLPIMNDVFEYINASKNIEVNRNYDELHRGYKIASYVDLVIAKPTSLGDELLAVGTPVLLYDFLPNANKVVNPAFDYEGYPVFVNSYEELEFRVKCFLENGFYMEEKAFGQLRNRFYGESSDGMVKKRLHSELISIYDSFSKKANTTDVGQELLSIREESF